MNNKYAIVIFIILVIIFIVVNSDIRNAVSKFIMSDGASAISNFNGGADLVAGDIIMKELPRASNVKYDLEGAFEGDCAVKIHEYCDLHNKKFGNVMYDVGVIKFKDGKAEGEIDVKGMKVSGFEGIYGRSISLECEGVKVYKIIGVRGKNA